MPLPRLPDLLAVLDGETHAARCQRVVALARAERDGAALARLLDRVEPTGKARYVRFVSANRPDQMPGIVEASHYPWPYIEGLRLDEAMNQLAMVVTGVYGEPLLKQHGAPLRIVVPWKEAGK